MDDLENINKITTQIAEKDAELASIFEDIISNLQHINESNQGSDIRDSRVSIPSKIRSEHLFGRFASNCVNVIPGSQSPFCRNYCICFAFDKWQASRGFKGITKSTNEYWLLCPRINRGTLIFSSAWDDDDFIEKYQKSFDNYAKDPQHTVAVILISTRGVSLQYINN